MFLFTQVEGCAISINYHLLTTSSSRDDTQRSPRGHVFDCFNLRDLKINARVLGGVSQAPRWLHVWEIEQGSGHYFLVRVNRGWAMLHTVFKISNVFLINNTSSVGRFTVKRDSHDFEDQVVILLVLRMFENIGTLCRFRKVTLWWCYVPFVAN